MPTPAAGEATPTAQRERRFFALLLYSSLMLTSGLIVLAEGVTRRTSIGLGLSAAIALLYPGVGHRALTDKDERLGRIFLGLVVPLALALFLVHPLFLAALFGLFPLCFALVSSWGHQVLAAGALSIGVILSNAADAGWDREGWFNGLLIGGVSLTFAVIMGRWISGIIAESKARQILIDELHATREQLAKVEHDEGVRAERERLSAEIHDTLAQGFSSILLLVRSAQSSIGIDDGRTRKLLVSAEQAAQENLDEARSLVAALAPVALQHGDLPAALLRLAARLEQETGVSVTVRVAGSAEDASLSPAEDVVLFRAVQESLTNVMRHAQATRATVELRYDERPVRAMVSDDGVGFDRQCAIGAGLSGMRLRLTSVGGELRIVSAPGNGTTIEMSLA